jgi:hypothetical protein
MTSADVETVRSEVVRVMADRREQRAAERFPINSTSSCAFMSPVLEDMPPVRIQNISTDGIGLISSEPLRDGLLLAINLINPAKKFSKTMLVRVVHCTELMGGTCLIGGTFLSPLTYEELCALVM